MRLGALPLIAAPLFLIPTMAQASDLSMHVFLYRRADEARQLAQRECKPLVIHFVPDSPLGAEQMKSFYTGKRRVREVVLEKVVIIAVPREKFPLFAQQLGVTSHAGFRTICPYDLRPVDRGAYRTVYDGQWWGGSAPLRNVSASAADSYLHRVAREFEDHATRHYLPTLEASHPDLPALLAALRFIETRRLAGYEPRLRQILDTRFVGRVGRDIEAACVDALVTTTADRMATAKLLALTATRDLPAARLCEKALERLAPPSFEALLSELTEAHPGPRLRKLAHLLGKLSKVRSPEPMTFWEKASENQRINAVANWETQLRLAGKL